MYNCCTVHLYVNVYEHEHTEVQYINRYIFQYFVHVFIQVHVHVHANEHVQVHTLRSCSCSYS
jgi:hypothetical protein